MSSPYKVAVIVGSLRKESLSRKIAKALCVLAPKSLEFTFVDIGQLPLYNEDLETANPPAAWTDFRQHVKAVDAVLFVTPEYNRSMPGCLKNALDVASRPYGQNVFNGKPGAVVSTSMGALAGFGVNHHLRQSLVFLNVPVMQQPEAYIGQSGNVLDDAGIPVKEETKAFFEAIMTAYAAWVELILRR